MIEKSRWRFSCSLCFSLDWCSFHLPFIIIPNLSFLVPFLIGSRDSFVAPKAVIIIIKASGGGDGKCKMDDGRGVVAENEILSREHRALYKTENSHAVIISSKHGGGGGFFPATVIQKIKDQTFSDYLCVY